MGKLIVLEGTDGCGKSTQFQLLTERLQKENTSFMKLRFPQYDEQSSALIRMYLGGQFGSSPDAVNAYAASCFYAVDRYASYKRVWQEPYENGTLILADRYTTSNAVHQAGKLPKDRQDDFIAWLYDFEFRKFGLPEPSLVICLDMPIEWTKKLMRQREQQTDTKADIHEQDTAYLERCRETMLHAAEFSGWKVVSCVQGGQLRSIEDIHEEVYALVRACLEEK